MAARLSYRESSPCRGLPLKARSGTRKRLAAIPLGMTEGCYKDDLVRVAPGFGRRRIVDLKGKNAYSSRSRISALEVSCMKSMLLLSVAACFGLLVVSGSALAHHGDVAYQDKVTELKQATVTNFQWSN